MRWNRDATYSFTVSKNGRLPLNIMDRAVLIEFMATGPDRAFSPILWKAANILKMLGFPNWLIYSLSHDLYCISRMVLAPHVDIWKWLWAHLSADSIRSRSGARLERAAIVRYRVLKLGNRRVFIDQPNIPQDRRAKWWGRRPGGFASATATVRSWMCNN